MAGLTALQGLRTGNIQEGKIVLIYSASRGTYAVQLSKNFGSNVTGLASVKMNKSCKILVLMTLLIIKKKILPSLSTVYLKEDLDYLTQLVEKGKLKSVIDKTYPFNEMSLAHEYYEQGHTAGKAVVQVIWKGN